MIKLWGRAGPVER